MSRFGYTDEADFEDPLALGRWRQAVRRSLEGKRGQAMLRELLVALDAMPGKTLCAGSFATPDGEFCTLGVLGAARGIKTDDLGDDAYCEAELVAKRFGCAHAMAAEIMFENDEAIDDWKFIDVVICGPVRPYHHEWGSHIKSVRVPDMQAGERRWRYMREWVAKQIKAAP